MGGTSGAVVGERIVAERQINSSWCDLTGCFLGGLETSRLACQHLRVQDNDEVLLSGSDSPSSMQAASASELGPGYVNEKVSFRIHNNQNRDGVF